jgi:hypothetical protein
MQNSVWIATFKHTVLSFMPILPNEPSLKSRKASFLSWIAFISLPSVLMSSTGKALANESSSLVETGYLSTAT